MENFTTSQTKAIQQLEKAVQECANQRIHLWASRDNLYCCSVENMNKFNREDYTTTIEMNCFKED